MSGRSLRRLPVLAHARHIGVSAMNVSTPGGASDVEVWLLAMEKVVNAEAASRMTGTTIVPSTSPSDAGTAVSQSKALENGC